MNVNFKSTLVMVAFAVALVTFRICVTQTITYAFLLWNLILSGVPLGISHYLRRQTTSGYSLIGWSFVWLLFLPNAPYILTDFLHFKYVNSMPAWFDLLLLATFSVTGLVLGLQSMMQMQSIWQARWSVKIGNVLIPACAILSGFGIYIGRFERYNSWDILSAPIDLAGDCIKLLSNVHTIGFTLGYGTLLLLLFHAFKPSRQPLN